MGLPLQPDLRPSRAPWRAWLPIAGLVGAIAILGLFDLSRHPTPKLLRSDGAPWEYVRTVERLIASAQQRIWVALYVARLPDEPVSDDPVIFLLQALVDAKARGVEVRVCLDQSKVWEAEEIETKHVAVAEWLRSRDVDVVLDELETTTHAKVVLVDRRWAVVGSHNWTRSALTRNREISLLVDDESLVREFETGLFARIPGWLD